MLGIKKYTFVKQNMKNGSCTLRREINKLSEERNISSLPAEARLE
jgi:hypothetical protein